MSEESAHVFRFEKARILPGLQALLSLGKTLKTDNSGHVSVSFPSLVSHYRTTYPQVLYIKHATPPKEDKALEKEYLFDVV